MVRKKLATAIAAIGALQADVVSALGMGDFSLFSALNQPLEAEIRLLNADDLDEAQILIDLADPKDFANSGVSREFFLTNLKFKVQMDGRGGGVIKITTREPVVEPYLNFLIEARWPSGRLLREYTVLLDLPVFSESQSQPVQAASSLSQAPSMPAAKTSASVPVVSSASSNQPSARQTLSGGQLKAGEEYRVRSDDTLWEIALNSRPAAGVSVQQTMVGIQRLNPEAFINGNINRLKAGSVLRLPTAEQISVTDRQAVGEVANQNKAWRQGADADSSSDVQLDATRGTAEATESYSTEPRLSIATGGDSDSGSTGDGMGRGAGSEALQNELALAQENLDKTGRENEELQSRLNDMEAKMATLQRLIELKDDQLAALQGDVATRDDQIDDQLASEESAEDAAVIEQPEQAKPEAAKPVEKPKPAPAPKEPELLHRKY